MHIRCAVRSTEEISLLGFIRVPPTLSPNLSLPPPPTQASFSLHLPLRVLPSLLPPATDWFFWTVFSFVHLHLNCIILTSIIFFWSSWFGYSCPSSLSSLSLDSSHWISHRPITTHPLNSPFFWSFLPFITLLNSRYCCNVQNLFIDPLWLTILPVLATFVFPFIPFTPPPRSTPRVLCLLKNFPELSGCTEPDTWCNVVVVVFLYKSVFFFIVLLYCTVAHCRGEGTAPSQTGSRDFFKQRTCGHPHTHTPRNSPRRLFSYATQVCHSSADKGPDDGKATFAFVSSWHGRRINGDHFLFKPCQ